MQFWKAVCAPFFCGAGSFIYTRVEKRPKSERLWRCLLQQRLYLFWTRRSFRVDIWQKDGDSSLLTLAPRCRVHRASPFLQWQKRRLWSIRLKKYSATMCCHLSDSLAVLSQGVLYGVSNNFLFLYIYIYRERKVQINLSAFRKFLQ